MANRVLSFMGKAPLSVMGVGSFDATRTPMINNDEIGLRSPIRHWYLYLYDGHVLCTVSYHIVSNFNGSVIARTILRTVSFRTETEDPRRLSSVECTMYYIRMSLVLVS